MNVDYFYSHMKKNVSPDLKYSNTSKSISIKSTFFLFTYITKEVYNI